MKKNHNKRTVFNEYIRNKTKIDLFNELRDANFENKELKESLNAIEKRNNAINIPKPSNISFLTLSDRINDSKDAIRKYKQQIRELKKAKNEMITKISNEIKSKILSTLEK
jgi:predicted transcriptional regulator